MEPAQTPLGRYLARTGRSKYSVAAAAKLPWKTIHRLARGQHSPTKRIAFAVEKATGGEVSAVELMGIEPSIVPTIDAPSTTDDLRSEDAAE